MDALAVRWTCSACAAELASRSLNMRPVAQAPGGFASSAAKEEAEKETRLSDTAETESSHI